MWRLVVVKIVQFIDYGSKDFKCYWKDILSMRPQVCQKDGSHLLDSCFVLLALISPLLTETKGKHLNEAIWSYIASENITTSWVHHCVLIPCTALSGMHSVPYWRGIFIVADIGDHAWSWHSLIPYGYGYTQTNCSMI